MVLYTDLLGVLGSASTLIGRRKFFGEVDGELTDSQTHGKHDKIGKLTLTAKVKVSPRNLEPVILRHADTTCLVLVSQRSAQCHGYAEHG